MSNAIIQAIGRCDPDEPLKPDDPRWQDFEQVRGTRLHFRVAQLLQSKTILHKYSHIALLGHRGGGKTSEINRIKAWAEEAGYLPLYTAVNQDADPNDLTFGDLFLLMLRLLEKEFRTNPRLSPLPEKATKNVADWFHDVTKIEEQEIERAISFTGEASLGGNFFLAKLLSGLSAIRKSTDKRREEIRVEVEKFPDDLCRNLNLLLDSAHQICRPAYPQGPLFILDNLDRYPSELVNEAIIKHGDQFNAVNAHTIFVLNIGLALKPVGDLVSDRFDQETLPMIPVFQRGNPQTPDEEVIEMVTEAIHKRVPQELFASLDLAREVARLSGGSPRDLLRLLKESLLESSEKIDGRAVQRAASIARAQLTRFLTYEHFAVLARVYLDKELNPDEIGRFLLFYRAALEYNHERWIGVHPLLWDAPEFQAALAAEKAKRGGLVRS